MKIKVQSLDGKASGDIELKDCAVEILSAAEPPPFPLDQRADEVDDARGERNMWLGRKKRSRHPGDRLSADNDLQCHHSGSKEAPLPVEKRGCSG